MPLGGSGQDKGSIGVKALFARFGVVHTDHLIRRQFVKIDAYRIY